MINLKKRLLAWEKILKMNSEENIENLKKIDILDTHLESDNLGDEIINFYCSNILNDLNITIDHRVPTHQKFSINLHSYVLKLITGTNILGPRSLSENSLWKVPDDINNLVNTGLMGVGWATYEKRTPLYTKMFLNKVLSDSFIHSVRDSYTLEKMKAICPNKKVLNTACPTMWELTEDYCKNIPQKKSNNVVTTITDYNESIIDWKMLDILLESYDNVYVWIQGKRDLSYLHNYSKFNSLKIIKNNLNDYTEFLKNNNVDYIGTRLHAGIHAMNLKKRSLIVSIDNRALEISKDTNLPIILRNDIPTILNSKINTDFSTEIKLPMENINKWKKQFISGEYI